MKVLVTCGPTWVAIDDVRVISNRSTGQMGHLIAEEFNKKNTRVTLLQGPVTDRAQLKDIKIIKYAYFHELARKLKEECLKNYDIIVHAAAVSDYTVKNRFNGKISSETALSLNLGPTPKLINLIRDWAPNSFIVGFKLEPNLTIKKFKGMTRKLFLDAQCDLVVVNQDKPVYKGYILNADLDIISRSTHKQDIAKILVRILL